MNAKLRVFSWTGCPAAFACYHYRKNEDGKQERPVALCRACSKVVMDMEKHFAKPRKQ